MRLPTTKCEIGHHELETCFGRIQTKYDATSALPPLVASWAADGCSAATRGDAAMDRNTTSSNSSDSGSSSSNPHDGGDVIFFSSGRIRYPTRRTPDGGTGDDNIRIVVNAKSCGDDNVIRQLDRDRCFGTWTDRDKIKGYGRGRERATEVQQQQARPPIPVLLQQ